MLIQGLGGTLYAYFMVVKPPSSFSSQKMGMVGELVHSILWKVYFSGPDYPQWSHPIANFLVVCSLHLSRAKDTLTAALLVKSYS